MSDYEKLATGKKIEALAQRVSEMSRDIEAIKRDVKTILHLIRCDKGQATTSDELQQSETRGEKL